MTVSDNCDLGNLRNIQEDRSSGRSAVKIRRFWGARATQQKEQQWSKEWMNNDTLPNWQPKEFREDKTNHSNTLQGKENGTALQQLDLLLFRFWYVKVVRGWNEVQRWTFPWGFSSVISTRATWVLGSFCLPLVGSYQPLQDQNPVTSGNTGFDRTS